MDTWQELIDREGEKPYMKALRGFLEKEYAQGIVYPQKKEIFLAFDLTPLDTVNVVLLGQDPYHGPHQAHGLSFSVADDQGTFPPSLKNIFRELEADTSIQRRETNLSDWAQQGVLLLNTVLTVRQGAAGSHRGKGWEEFTDQAIQLLNQQSREIIFVLWGKEAQEKEKLITNPKHVILKSAHPSPLAAYRGFFGSRPFSRINVYLESFGRIGIKW